MLVLQAERMFQQPAAVFAEVLAFLELETWMPSHFGTKNSGRYQDPMSPAAWAHLEDYFAPHNERLFDLLGARYDWR